jgi:hypothetical protein
MHLVTISNRKPGSSIIVSIIVSFVTFQSCPGKKNHRDRQCKARGYPAESHNFEGQSKITSILTFSLLSPVYTIKVSVIKVGILHAGKL